MADNVVDKHCEGCVYLCTISRWDRCCEYFIKTGKRRPCPAGKECTVKMRKGKKKDG